jgi:hypothetical protein
MFLKHRLLALPVVDEAGHLHGVADVAMLTGDLADVTARENAEDVFQLIGGNASQPSSDRRGFLDRFPWLLCNIGGGLIAALIAGWYESLLDAVIVLALFIPVVLAVSESVAMQSVTLTLHNLHGTRADLRFLLKALRRELVTAGFLGASCGAVIGAVVWGWKGAPMVAAVIMFTVAMAMTTAALLSAAILPLSTSYNICEGLGIESGVDKRFSEAPGFYWLYTMLIVFGAGIVLVPHLPLIKLIVLSQVANGIVLPFVLYFMLRLVNREDLMGRYKNSQAANVIAWGTGGVMVALTLALIWTSIFSG